MHPRDFSSSPPGSGAETNVEESTVHGSIARPCSMTADTPVAAIPCDNGQIGHGSGRISMYHVVKESTGALTGILTPGISITENWEGSIARCGVGAAETAIESRLALNTPSSVAADSLRLAVRSKAQAEQYETDLAANNEPQVLPRSSTANMPSPGQRLTEQRPSTSILGPYRSEAIQHYRR